MKKNNDFIIINAIFFQINIVAKETILQLLKKPYFDEKTSFLTKKSYNSTTTILTIVMIFFQIRVYCKGASLISPYIKNILFIYNEINESFLLI